MICVIIHSSICIYTHHLHKAHEMGSCGYTVLSVHILSHMFNFQSYRIVLQRLWHCSIWRIWYLFMSVGYTLVFHGFQHLRFLSPWMIISLNMVFRQALPYLQQKNNIMNHGIKEATIFILSCFVHSSKLFTFFLGTDWGFERNSSQYEDYGMT